MFFVFVLAIPLDQGCRQIGGQRGNILERALLFLIKGLWWQLRDFCLEVTTVNRLSNLFNSKLGTRSSLHFFETHPFKRLK